MGWFSLWILISDFVVNVVVKGCLDLEELGVVFLIEGIEIFNGLIIVDVIVNIWMLVIDVGVYD